MIVIVSGPGGVGKGTVVARLLERQPEPLAVAVVDDPAPPAGRAGRCLRVRRPGRLPGRASARGGLRRSGPSSPGRAQPLRHPDRWTPPDAPGRACSRSSWTEPSRSRRRHPDAVLILIVAPGPEAQEAPAASPGRRRGQRAASPGRGRGRGAPGTADRRLRGRQRRRRPGRGRGGRYTRSTSRPLTRALAPCARQADPTRPPTSPNGDSCRRCPTVTRP